MLDTPTFYPIKTINTIKVSRINFILETFYFLTRFSLLQALQVS